MSGSDDGDDDAEDSENDEEMSDDDVEDQAGKRGRAPAKGSEGASHENGAAQGRTTQRATNRQELQELFAKKMQQFVANRPREDGPKAEKASEARKRKREERQEKKKKLKAKEKQKQIFSDELKFLLKQLIEN